MKELNILLCQNNEKSSLLITKTKAKSIFIYMNNFMHKIKNSLNAKRGLFVFLILFSIVLIVLGVIAAINFSGGVLVVDLGNISYIQFLKDECSFVSLLFKLMLSLLIFFSVICVCGSKPYLFPLGLLFYGYLVYSQTVIFMSLILIYGFFNCAIFALLLLIYVFLISFVFILLVIEISCCCNTTNYFKTVINWNNSNFLLYLILIILISLVFCLILSILKSFVLLLVY